MIKSSRNPIRRHLSISGFTLVELLVVIGIFGIAATSMFSLYLSMQKTSSVQEKVIDLQQNVRIAIDSLARDIRMAGFLIPNTNTALDIGSNATTLILRTATPFYATARVSAELEVPGPSAATDDRIFTIAEAEMCDRFEAGNTVRLIRAMDGLQPINLDLTVKSVHRGPTPPDPGDPPTMTLNGLVTPDPIQYISGDMIVRVGAADTDPATITWTLNGSELRRSGDAVVSDIASVTFSYLLKNGTEIAVPSAAALADIAAVRVTLTAVADSGPQADGVDRQRTLTTLIRMRN